MEVDEEQSDFQTLPTGVLHGILSFLDPRSLARSSCINTAWRAEADSHVLWSGHVRELWSDKCYVPQRFQLLRSQAPKQAYWMSIQDCHRCAITQDELCAWAWRFRFCHSDDGYWLPRRPFSRYFHPGGAVVTVPMQGGLWGEPRTWRLHQARMKQGCQELSTLVQVDNFPPMEVGRTRDWGWVLESAWVEVVAETQEPNLGRGLESVTRGVQELHASEMKARLQAQQQGGASPGAVGQSPA